MSYEKDDPGFEDDLEESKKFVEKAARWLGDKGYPVIIEPTFLRTNISDMREFSDNGDLRIVQRVEVKRRNLKFTCADDFPYPSIIVDVAHTWDRARPKPYAYLIYNEGATALCVVYGKSFPVWQKVTKPDRFKKRDRTFYECPIGECEFHVLDATTSVKADLMAEHREWLEEYGE
jgi:hypothetical protein